MTKETRTITQTKIYKLVLNPITANLERTNIVAIAFDKDELISWYEDQKADEPYSENGYRKVFKKDSKLELYNPLDIADHVGVLEEWIRDENTIYYYVSEAERSMGFTEVPELVGI